MNGNNTAAVVVVASLLLGASPFILNEALLEESSFVLPAEAEGVDLPENETNASVGAEASEELKFGSIPLEFNATKTITVDSPEAMTLASLSSTGNISEHLIYDTPQLFTGAREIEVTFAPQHEGNFTGNVTVKTETSDSGLGDRWLELKQHFY